MPVRKIIVPPPVTGIGLSIAMERAYRDALITCMAAYTIRVNADGTLAGFGLSRTELMSP